MLTIHYEKEAEKVLKFRADTQLLLLNEMAETSHGFSSLNRLSLSDWFQYKFKERRKKKNQNARTTNCRNHQVKKSTSHPWQEIDSIHLYLHIVILQ